MYDTISLNGSKIYQSAGRFEKYVDTQIGIYVHYPGQLIRSLSNPVFRTNFEHYTWDKILTIEILGVTLLRERAESNYPCDTNVEDDDARIQIKIMKLLGCRPIYWKYVQPEVTAFPECESQTELRMMYHYINRYKELMLSLAPPCVRMNAMSVHYWDHVNHMASYDKKIRKITFQYMESNYQEIENLQDFGFESFISGLGGYVGIFLGYSLLQIPDLLGKVSNLFGKIKP